MKRIMFGLGMAMLLLLATSGARAADKPSATLELKEGSVAAGIGFSWGGGTLVYKGKTYNVAVDGITVGSVGINEATASGKVFNLKHLKDFDGIYTAVNVDATLAGGGAVASMKNQNGVRIDLKATTAGVKLTLGASGVNLKIKE